MSVPIAVPLANTVIVTVPLSANSLDGGVTSALLAALAPVWPALEPWLIVAAVVLVMGVATEVVVRELQRLQRLQRGAAPAGVDPAAASTRRATR